MTDNTKDPMHTVASIETTSSKEEANAMLESGGILLGACKQQSEQNEYLIYAIGLPASGNH